MRLALAILCLATPAMAEITSADYAEPTGRYAHGVLGDSIEWGTLVIGLTDGTVRRIQLPKDRVFEDTAPRLADVDGDGAPEVIVVESAQTAGARLVIYGETGEIAATPYIGTPFRWLAPVGIADLDGDGAVEIAYIDRPHLAKTLRIWRFDEGQLSEIATLGGLSNHRIGESDIAGGIRDCGAGPEMIMATGDWRRVVSVTYDGSLTTTDIGPHQDRSSFSAAMACQN